MRPIHEHVQPEADTSFACIDWRGPEFECPYHVHPEFEINLILGSTGRRLVGDHLGDFAPGDLVLLGARLPHTYFHAPGQSSGKDWAHSLYVQFLPECLGKPFFALGEMAGVASLLERSRRGLRFGSATSAQTARLLQMIHAGRGPQRIARFIELLHGLAQSRDAVPLASAGYVPVAEHRDSERLNRALDYMHRNLEDHVGLEDVAEAARMSPQGFSRFFHRHMRKPFSVYLTELRVGIACRLLVETDLPVIEVCFKSGFNNLSNFGRHFRRNKGLTPREFRRDSTSQAK